MSHVAIGAALALEDVFAGERLAAFSLASFANREHRAWPGTRVAAVRAGLSRSQYLAARDSLQKRGLVAVEDTGGGRGHSPVVAVMFAQAGPWFEGEINAPLFEAVLGYCRARGSARLLLATFAALADDQLNVSGLGTDEIRAAAGMADSTYRRARTALLASGELVLETAGGGRARTNRWLLRDPRSSDAQPASARRKRIAPSRTSRPLVAFAEERSTAEARGQTSPRTETVESLKGPRLTGVSTLNPVQIRTVRAVNRPGLTGVTRLNPAQHRTVLPKTPPETPSQTPPADARAGREPKNPRTSPPSPPEGGSDAGSVTIVEDYVTDRGRRRQRTVGIEVDAIRAELAEPTTAERSAWAHIRCELHRRAGESLFEIWFSQLELLAVDQAGRLLLACSPSTRGWVAERFGRLLEASARSAGRELRLATDRELQLLRALGAAPRSEPATPLTDLISHNQQEAS
jgi:hypothetical protein